jgi:CPA2 family monovalent cation:H+ antiporter-2
MGAVLPWSALTTLVLSAGLSQIGEFSFILGQEGLSLGILERDQYSLILAGALLSITLNTPMFKLIQPMERWLQRFPNLWKLFNRHSPLPAHDTETYKDHVVIVGYGRVGRHIVGLLQELGIPALVVDADAHRVEELNQRGIATLFGDASNSEVLMHTGLKYARALVVAGPDEAASELVVASARDIAPGLPIIARASTEDGIDALTKLGAQEVVHPELEGGLEIVRYTLLQLGFHSQEIYRYTDAVRRDHYDLDINTDEEHRLLQELMDAANRIEIRWFRLQSESPLIGQTLAAANLRSRAGASVVALLRDGQLMANPKSITVFQADDRIGLIGDQEEIEAAERLLSESDSESNPIGVEWET